MSIHFPTSAAQAEERYQRHCSSDPFASIVPALLNSADIAKYVAAVGMVHPMPTDDDQKPASIALHLGGECVWFDPSGTQHKVDIQKPSDVLEIAPNSIVFVSTAEELRLPGYIAARFNLVIKYVHAGLLLGTGPLVDPGFCGKLVIPLHNLTTNRYVLHGGQKIIWAEFTKLSSNVAWSARGEEMTYQHVGRIAPLGARKARGGPPEWYLGLAPRDRDNPTRVKVQSALPGIQAAAEAAAKAANRAAAFAWGGLVLGAITVVAALATLLYGNFTVLSQLNDQAEAHAAQMRAAEQTLEGYRLKLQLAPIDPQMGQQGTEQGGECEP